jgi:hypothetical protein
MNEYINCSQVDCGILSQSGMWSSWITTGLLLFGIIFFLIIKNKSNKEDKKWKNKKY